MASSIPNIPDEPGRYFLNTPHCLRILHVTFLSGLLFLCGCGTTGPQKQLMIPELSRSFGPGTIISTVEKQPVSFESLIEDLASVHIVYVGETHTNPVHHEIQLRILEALHERRPDLIVGMEMFDVSYQDVLRQWRSGLLDEKAFLQQTHWNANWKYDFSLYRPLLDFIRDQQIHLYGLNVPFHIPPKIAAGGIATLSECDRAYLPEHLDFASLKHRDYVKEVFEKHSHALPAYDFDNFYAAQVVWEEIMAETISRNIGDRFLVAFVGNGHITHKFGIPERAWKRTERTYRTIMPATVGTPVELSAADYIWVTPAAGRSPHMPP